MYILGLSQKSTGLQAMVISLLLASSLPAIGQTYGPNGTTVIDKAVNIVQATTVAVHLQAIVAQSFEVQTDGILTRIDLFSNGPLTGLSDITLTLRSGDGFGGTLLGTFMQTVGPNDFDFLVNGYPIALDIGRLQLAVESGSSYTLIIDDVSNGSSLADLGILGDSDDAYDLGSFYGMNGLGALDLHFQTYVTSSIPVPSARFILALGLAGIGLAATGRRIRRAIGTRRRRRAHDIRHAPEPSGFR